MWTKELNIQSETSTKKSDIFVIPRDNPQGHEYIVYAPLQNIAFTTNKDGAIVVEKYKRGESLTDGERKSIVGGYLDVIENTDISIPINKNLDVNNSVVFILSQMCNLSCTYCFAQESRSKVSLDINTIKSVVNIVLNRSNDDAKFVFLGGGEPFVTWDLLRDSILYIRGQANKTHKKADIIITTNATLISKEQASFLHENQVQIGISFDILPEIQNTQRPWSLSKKGSFEHVESTIRKLDDAKVEYSIRSTITKANVNLMDEMIQYVVSHFKNAKDLHFEPVASKDDNDERFYHDFLESFIKAREIGKNNHINVYNSLTKSFNKLNTRFCRGEFCITPTRKVVACHRFSSENELAFKKVLYGEVGEYISLDKEMKNNVLLLLNTKRNECHNCFAKWHCAGGCLGERLVHSPHQQEIKCQFTKALILKLLDETLTLQ